MGAKTHCNPARNHNVVQGATRHSLQGATGCYNEVQEHKPCRVPQGATGCHKDLVKVLEHTPCKVPQGTTRYYKLLQVATRRPLPGPLTMVALSADNSALLGFVEIETLLIQHGLK